MAISSFDSGGSLVQGPVQGQPAFFALLPFPTPDIFAPSLTHQSLTMSSSLDSSPAPQQVWQLITSIGQSKTLPRYHLITSLVKLHAQNETAWIDTANSITSRDPILLFHEIRC
ncbi:hypothetical protein QYF36_013755 [Acer negundo]|nr:hypothetical protein QYF36_013755 [Acer negundo]